MWITQCHKPPMTGNGAPIPLIKIRWWLGDGALMAFGSPHKTGVRGDLIKMPLEFPVTFLSLEIHHLTWENWWITKLMCKSVELTPALSQLGETLPKIHGTSAVFWSRSWCFGMIIPGGSPDVGVFPWTMDLLMAPHGSWWLLFWRRIPPWWFGWQCWSPSPRHANHVCHPSLFVHPWSGGKPMEKRDLQKSLVVIVAAIPAPHLIISVSYLVGGLEHFLFFPYIGNNHPNWLIFFRGVAQPPTRYHYPTISPWLSKITDENGDASYWLCHSTKLPGGCRNSTPDASDHGGHRWGKSPDGWGKTLGIWPAKPMVGF